MVKRDQHCNGVSSPRENCYFFDLTVFESPLSFSGILVRTGIDPSLPMQIARLGKGERSVFSLSMGFSGGSRSSCSASLEDGVSR